MGRRPRAVRLAIPAAFVAILTFVALWRVSAPTAPASGGATSRPEPLGPLTQIAEVLTENSIGRRASLERVVVREVPSPRTLWIGTDDDRVFVVLDPDVKNASAVPLRAGLARDADWPGARGASRGHRDPAMGARSGDGEGRARAWHLPARHRDPRLRIRQNT